MKLTDTTPRTAPGPGDLWTPPVDEPDATCDVCDIEYTPTVDGETARCPGCVQIQQFDRGQLEEHTRDLAEQLDAALSRQGAAVREVERLRRLVGVLEDQRDLYFEQARELQRSPAGIARRIVTDALIDEKAEGLRDDRDRWEHTARRYAHHDTACSWWTHRRSECDCGLTALLTGKAGS